MDRGRSSSAGSAGDAGAGAALEGEGLEEIDAKTATHEEAASVAGGELGISPEKDALGAGPDAEIDVVVTILLEEIAVAVAHEAARALRELKKGSLLVISRDSSRFGREFIMAVLRLSRTDLVPSLSPRSYCLVLLEGQSKP